jgi:Flp pilus assembly protein TadG
MPDKVRTKTTGQALVEFAVLLPLLLILLLGTIEFGFLLYNQQVITNASREGARYGIVSRSPRRDASEIETVVDNYCSDHLITFGTGEPETTVQPDPTTGSVFGDDLRVEVSFPYQFLVLPEFLGELARVDTLEATTTMKYE